MRVTIEGRSKGTGPNSKKEVGRKLQLVRAGRELTFRILQPNDKEYAHVSIDSDDLREKLVELGFMQEARAAWV